MDTTIGAEDSADQSSTEALRLALLWVFPNVQGVTLRVGQGPWRIGRAASCQIPVGSEAASREHALVFCQGPLVILRDLESTNGTFINGTPIQQVPVRQGSVIRIGEWVGVFCLMPPFVVDEPFFRELSPGYLAGPTLSRALGPLALAAKTDLPIIIEGATGTGKEGVAQYIHQQSARSGPFHAINCAAIPAEMAESELFGHKRGAFTGARDASIGHFRAAAGGTLFLDEVVELPQPVQAKLLRVLQERNVTPLGETSPIATDVRIIAACQEPLESVVSRGAFRADLRARLSGLVVRVPPLCERIEDIPHLFRHFLQIHSGGDAPVVEGKVIERLCLYAWPSNVRELELLARQLLVAVGNGLEPRIKRAHLPIPIREAGPREVPDAGEDRQLKQLARALYDARGNITKASRSLGISRARAYRLMAGVSVEGLLAHYSRGHGQPLGDGDE